MKRVRIAMLDRLAAHPLFMCSFRPLFLAAAAYAAVALSVWVGYVGFDLALPAVPGGPVVWHAHEMIFGFVLAAVSGFVLTAIPEFASSPPFGARIAVAFALLWSLGRVLFWMSGVLGPWPAALANTAMVGLLACAVAPRLLRDAERRHLGFLWGLAALTVCVAGFYWDLERGLYPMRWMHASVGVMTMLIVVAMSRISMRILNDALEAQHRDGVGEAPEYLARPPRRNLAIFVIALFTLAEFFTPLSAVTGWLGLAAAAAMFNLLNDWHVGRALLTRWSFMLYVVYWLIALGYAALGLSVLGWGVPPGTGWHLLTVGAMGISILSVFCIAGRLHAGYPLDTRRWVAVAASLIVIAAVLREASAFAVNGPKALLILSGLGWIAAFALVCTFIGVLWLRARVDGGHGCEEARASAGAQA